MTWKNMVSSCFSSLQNFPGFFQQGRMREVDLGAHTIRSHGGKIAKSHMLDWFILVLLGAIEITLYLITPFNRYVGKDMMRDLKYPFKDNTVPTWSVPLYAVLLPIVVFVFVYIRRRDAYDLHHSILGLLFSMLITGVITDSLKVALGYPRPNFFFRCFPDGKEFYDQLGDVICHGKASDIKEGHKSFPSGHASWSFAGLTFLSLYLSGKIQVFDRKGHVAKLCVITLPLLAAALVGVSRIDDYWHHWEDVVAGSLLGLIVATFCYMQFFPAPYHEQGWGPYAYFQALELRSDNTGHANSLNMQTMDAQVINIQLSQNREGFESLDELESGRR
ncbi:lipid phosphate phosphatase 1-like [Mercurialis annua]|uniref:lipid phosphate phosphatase 1-like n=1 Tax=Mercurialis annua TaxID=3986 RepID=UPI00215EF1D0|nr:lipid phosphate phosphatase 1-like [Mercurialis annua]